MAENTQPAQNNAVSGEEQVIRQYAQAAGLDVSRPEHVGIIVQTLQSAAASGMSADNKTQVTAIIAVMQELARLQGKPEEMHALATNIGIDVNAVEQQRQQAFGQLDQMDKQIMQNSAKLQELKSKAGSRNIINYVAGVIGTIGGVWLSNIAMKKYYKDDLVELKDKKNVVQTNKDGTAKMTFPEKNVWLRRLGRTVSGIAGFGILGKISAAIFTKPIENEFIQVEEQTIKLQAKKQEMEDAIQTQDMGFVENFTKRLLEVAVQQVNEQVKAESAKQTQHAASHHQKPHASNAHHASDHADHSQAAEHYVKRMEGVNEEREEAKKEVELQERPAMHTVQNAVEPVVVKRETGAEMIPAVHEEGKFAAAVGKKPESHAAAVSAVNAESMQPAL